MRIWYRNAAGCPDGAAFVTRLAALGRQAQLATAGDRVDFVVTLGGPEPTPETLGRLERQIESGTVAIREFRAARCEDVAEALALTLELALQPSAAPAPDPSPALAPPLARATSKSYAEVVPASTAVAPAEPAPIEPAQHTASSRVSLSLGLQATLLTGAAPAALPGVAVFVGLAREDLQPRARLSLRANYRQARASLSDSELSVAVMAARPEGCVWSWSLGVFSLDPCVGLDVGLLRVAGESERGRADKGIWLGAAAHLRAIWRVSPQFAVEGELGALVPVVRYALGRGEDPTDLFQTEPVGLAVGLGAAWLAP